MPRLLTPEELNGLLESLCTSEHLRPWLGEDRIHELQAEYYRHFGPLISGRLTQLTQLTDMEMAAVNEVVDQNAPISKTEIFEASIKALADALVKRGFDEQEILAMWNGWLEHYGRPRRLT
jgi:hypothetical protein